MNHVIFWQHALLSKYGDFLKNPQDFATLGYVSIKILFFLNVKFRQKKERKKP